MEIDLKKTNDELRVMDIEQRIRWAIRTFGNHAILLSSMQKNDTVLMHLFFKAGLKNEILFADTQYHFIETLWLRDEWIRRYQVNIVTLYPELTPEQQEQKYKRKLFMSEDGQPLCCNIRKEKPTIDHMVINGHKLIIGGRRRAEGQARASLEYIERDPRYEGYEMNPLVDWTEAQVDKYIDDHQVVIHPLHAQCYPSIGCECCTTPVRPGEDERAGRWRHLRQLNDSGHLYCGINFSDGAGI